MKRLLIALILLLWTITAIAQETNDVTLEPYENPTMYLQGLKPEGWPLATPGGYARDPRSGDITLLVMQSAPLARPAMEETLLRQFDFDVLPEIETTIEGNFTWDIYRFDVDVRGTPVALSLGLVEGQDRTFVTLLQSTPEEHDSLREAVFNPVIQSLAYFDPDAETAAEELPYTVEDVTFTSGELTLSGTLTMPTDGDNLTAVVLVSGSGAQDRDSSLAPVAEIRPFRDLADGLTRGGIAVLRYDERGVGASDGDFLTADLNAFRADALAAVDYLNERAEIAQVGVIGHSEGGLYLPQMVLEDQVQFGVAIAPPTVSLIDILREQNRLVQIGAGRSAEQVDAVINAFDAVIDALRTDADEDTLRSAVSDLLSAQTGEQAPPDNLVNAGLEQFLSPLFASYLDYDPAQYWPQVNDPVLVIFGELDTQVVLSQNLPPLESLANPAVTIVTVQGMNHLMQAAETGAVSEYGVLEQTIMPDVYAQILMWLEANVTN